MAREKFILEPIRRQHTERSNGEVVRISKEAYNVLVDMANESVLNLGQVASKAILFAQEHLEYGYENNKEEEVS